MVACGAVVGCGAGMWLDVVPVCVWVGCIREYVTGRYCRLVLEVYGRVWYCRLVDLGTGVW